MPLYGNDEQLDRHHRHRPGSPRAVAHREQAVLRVRHEVRRAAEHADLPGVHRHARHAAGDQPQGVRAGPAAAAALNCQIARFTKWDRKNYYYPDLPKGYQISQYDLPLSHDGWLEIEAEKGQSQPDNLGRCRPFGCIAEGGPVPFSASPSFELRRIGIIRVHLEEDAGKSMHDEGGKGGSPNLPAAEQGQSHGADRGGQSPSPRQSPSP